jgi:uncharacterized membrane protein
VTRRHANEGSHGASLAPLRQSAAVLMIERLRLFTDAVFAIIMTLLALEIRVPDGALLNSTQGVLDALGDMLPRLGSYAISFFVVAMLWRAHLRRYCHLLTLSRAAVSGNLLQLLFVGLIPFATTMLNRSTNPLVVTIYALIIMANVLIAWLVWTLAIRDPARLSPEYTLAMRRESNWRSALASAVFAASAAIAWWSSEAAMYSWALLIPANRLVARLARRSRAPVPSSVAGR